MRTYRRLGDVPRKRHMRFEVDGKPIYEELFGREGFSGPSSLLYHRNMPEAAHDISAGPAEMITPEREQVHEHAHLEGFHLQPDGDVVTGRKWLLVNDDIHIGLAIPVRQQEVLCVNGSADEVLFVHRGAGVLHTQFGTLPFGTHDYVVIPRGTIYRVELDSLDDVRILALEVTGIVDSPDRYRARNGQLTEIAPYSERDFRGPEALEAGDDGTAEVWLKRAGRVSRYRVDHHPFDLVGWDGTVYPVAFNIHDFEPRAGRFHVPPPIHQTFQAHNLVICSFVPRKLDWDPDAVMLPYHHSNLDSDEVLYYVAGDYAARRGVKQSSFTHHVGGVPHGPQPGALEASFDRARETDELAVMIDTFRPLHRTEVARQIVDREYPFSWHTGGMRGTEFDSLSSARDDGSPLARWTTEQVEAGGWIRRMFAEGQRLRTAHGDDAVIDLSLGQPLDAPPVVREALARAASEDFPGRHAYMPNLGYPELRERAAEDVDADGVTASCVAMTGGAAGAMCLALRAFVNTGDEVVGIAPYFPEFRPYCETGGLSFVPVHTDDASQRVDVDGLVRALSERTAALIINTPSNPSGHVIEHEEMTEIVDVIEHHNARTGRRLLLIVDEAYRNLVYEPARRVEPFAYYEHTVLARSFSKDMGLAGERIGYLALHPSLAGEQTDRGLESCMRALGMVSAPATPQRALLHLESWHSDVEQYRVLRGHSRDAALQAGLDVAEPQGGIFLWIRSPWPDTLAYVSALAACNVLVTPGIAFEVPERLRLCFTSTPDRLTRALAIAGEVAALGPA